jgi:hypothetical protein
MDYIKSSLSNIPISTISVAFIQHVELKTVTEGREYVP